MNIKIKKLGNHWYPNIDHDRDFNISFCKNAERYFNLLSTPRVINSEELDIEFEEIGIEISGINIIYFYEEDIIRYLTTDDYFDIRLKINDIMFVISSDLYMLLEEQYHFNFHKTSYKIHIY